MPYFKLTIFHITLRGPGAEILNFHEIHNQIKDVQNVLFGDHKLYVLFGRNLDTLH